jgi:hypothetical protein
VVVGNSDPDHHPSRPALALGRKLELKRYFLENGGDYGIWKRFIVVAPWHSTADYYSARAVLAIAEKLQGISHA